MQNNYSIVAGMGKTGLSIARFLHAQNKPFIIFDTRKRHEWLGAEAQVRLFHAIDKNIQFYFGELDSQVIENAKDLIVSPGVSLQDRTIRHGRRLGKPIYGDIELFLRYCTKPVIGITGSNGKSTLTTLLGLVLEGAEYKVGVGGNIGIPALEMLNKEFDVFVLELSSFQLETIVKPSIDVACLLNISEDHMDRYNSFEDYKDAKHIIYHGARKVVFNQNDIHTHPSDKVTMDRLGFGIDVSADLARFEYWYDSTDGYLKFGERVIIHESELALHGRHNVTNVLALFSIAKQFGLTEAHCTEILREFDGLPHRCQVVGKFSGVTYINDSKATNVGAAQAAINGLVKNYNKLILIAGGVGKGADFSELAITIKENIVDVVLMGQDASRIEKSLTIAPEVNIHRVSNMLEAVKQAQAVCQKGDVVLLAPACASFDMFKGFEDRGDAFVRAVLELNK